MLRVLVLTITVSCGLLGGVLGLAVPNEESGVVAAQAQQNTPRGAFTNVRGLSQDYRVGVGDTLEIQVVDTAELNQTVKVSAEGEIYFPPVGAVPVAGLTAAEAEARIASVLQERKLVREPQVLIYIRDYQAKRIYLMGEFVYPGEFVMSQNLSVMDAILLAGGLGPYPPRYGYLHHHVSKQNADGPPAPNLLAKPDAPREGTEIFKIDLQPFLEGKAPEPDITLQQGDYLIVPRREVEFFFVLGEVLSPSNYAFPTGKTLMASQAIAQAGGPTSAAKTSRGVVVRQDKGGEREEIKVDFAAIIKGKKPDFEVLPNDVIYIPSSKLTIIKDDYITKTDLFIEGTAFRVGRYYQLPADARQQQGGPLFRTVR
jgi:polysaccharide export outer membrane protein